MSNQHTWRIKRIETKKNANKIGNPKQKPLDPH